MLNILKGCFLVLGCTVLLGVVVYFAPYVLPEPAPPRRDLDPYRQRLLDECMQELNGSVPLLDGVQSLFVARPEQDVDRYIEDAIRDELALDYELVFLDDLDNEKRKQADFFLEDKRMAVEMRLAALASLAGTDGALRTVVKRFSAGRKEGQEAEVAFVVSVYDTRTGTFRDESRKEIGASMGKGWTWMYFSTRMHHMSAVWRIILWLFGTALLPFATFFIVVAVTRHERNLANAILVGTYSLISFLLAWVLVGFWIESFLTVLALIAALLVGSLYQVVACTWIHELEKSG